MSQPSSESDSNISSVMTKKATLDIYTIMLIVALVSLLMACMFLALEINEYGGFGAVAMITEPVNSLLAESWA